MAAAPAVAGAEPPPGFGSPVAIPWLKDKHGERLTSGAPGEVIVTRPGHYEPIEVLILAPGHEDAAPQTLAAEGDLLVVAAASTGRAVAAWAEARSYGADVLRVAQRSPGAAFGDAADIAVISADVRPLAAAVNAHGDEVLVYYTRVGPDDAQMVYATVRPRGGSFGTPVALGRADHDGYGYIYASAVIDDAGRATVAWTVNEDGKRPLRAVTGDANGFGAPQLLDDQAARNTGYLNMRLDGSGRVALQWGSREGINSAFVMFARKPPGGAFETPLQLGNGDRLQLAVSPAGDAFVTWDGRITGDGTNYNDGMTNVRLVTTPMGGGPVTRLYDGGGRGMELAAIDVDEAGNLVVAHFPGSFYRRGRDDLHITTGTANGLEETRELGCPAPRGEAVNVLTSSPDDTAILLRNVDDWSWTIIRAVPGKAREPRACDPNEHADQPYILPPGVRPPAPTGNDPPPSTGALPSLSIDAPAAVAARTLKRLRVAVSTGRAGRVRLTGAVAVRGKRLGSFKPVAWRAASAGRRTIRLRLSARRGWATRARRGRAVANLKVVFTPRAGKSVTRRARVRVR